jgi:uncharacterized membrane protein
MIKNLHPNRLEALTDGVFSIIMTILVLEVKVPELKGNYNNQELFDALVHEWPIIVGYFASFAILGTYWMAHNFIFQNYVRHIDRVLGYINMFFLMFASFIPFSAHFLGSYYQYSAAIILYAVNVIAIGASLYVLRNYILKNDYLRKDEINRKDIIHGSIRIAMPPLFAVFSIITSFWNYELSLILFMVPVIFNIVPGGINYLETKFIHGKN